MKQTHRIKSLDGRLEVVDIESDGLIKMRKRLAGDNPRVTIMTDEAPDNRPVLLFDPGLIIFSVGARPRKLKGS